jgi:hypothetical protein
MGFSPISLSLVATVMVPGTWAKSDIVTIVHADSFRLGMLRVVIHVVLKAIVARRQNLVFLIYSDEPRCSASTTLSL